jgi:hypothetical protein
MKTEYLRRNLNVAKAAGANANAEATLKRLRAMQNPPKWLIASLEGIAERTKPLPAELAAYRDAAPDRPRYGDIPLSPATPKNL